MSKQEMFDQRYRTEETPWELNRADVNLIRVVEEAGIGPCRALEIGCGTGSNAVWLAQNKFEVTGFDFSPLAIERAEKKAEEAGVDVRFLVSDFLKETPAEPDADFIFDRGCFHSFDAAGDRETFARNAALHLKPGGLWLSIIGNADDDPRDTGPPMRTAKDIVLAVEPWFEILFLKSGTFDSERERPARCWLCLLKKRQG